MSAEMFGQDSRVKIVWAAGPKPDDDAKLGSAEGGARRAALRGMTGGDKGESQGMPPLAGRSRAGLSRARLWYQISWTVCPSDSRSWPEPVPRCVSGSTAYRQVIRRGYSRAWTRVIRTTVFHIPRRSERRAPLTYAQQGIWFRHQLAPESAVWNISRTWTVSGPLDLTALERALTEIVRRHESLRTRYIVAGGEPVQEVMPVATVAIELLDAREPASGVRQAADISRPAGSPRFRPGLTRDGPSRCRRPGP